MGRHKGYTLTGPGTLLETNGVANPNQALLNLIAGVGIILTPDGFGGVTIDASTAMQIGNPVGGANPFSVLVTDGSSLLAQVTPSADGFLFWDNTAQTYGFTPNAASLTIGDFIFSSSANEVLYTSPFNRLESDSGFYRDSGNNFLTVIQQTDGANTQGQIIGTTGVWVIESLDLVSTDNSRVIANSTFVRNQHFAGTGESTIFQYGGTGWIGGWTDAMANLSSNISGTSSGVSILASSSTTGFSSSLVADSNQYVMKWLNGAGIVAQVYGNVFGQNMYWTNATIQSLISAGPTFAKIEYDNGAGAISHSIYSASDFTTNFADANGYSSQNYGAGSQTYQIYTTPYQLYTDESVTYNPGDTLTDSNTGATGDVISDDGNGLVLLGNVVGLFQNGDQVDDGFGNIATLTADGGIYSALHGAGQNVTPGLTRYAMFLNTITSGGVNDRYEIAHPEKINFRAPSLTNVSSGLNASFNFNNNINGTVSHSFTNNDGGTNAALQFLLYNGASQFMIGLVGSGNSSYGGVFTPSTVRFDNTQGDIAYVVGNSAKVHLFNVGGSGTANTKFGVSVDGVFVGNGKSSASPANGSIYGTEGLGTDIGGGSVIINGGQGTGTGQGGYIYFQTARKAGSTGSSLNALNTMAVVNENQFITTAGRSINVTPHGDSDYLAKITDELVSMSVVSSRTVTLPSAGAVGVGAVLTIKDAIGAATGGVTITIDPDGTDSIDLDVSGYIINTAFGSITIVSDGISNWAIISKIV